MTCGQCATIRKGELIAATAMDSPASIHGVCVALREFCPNCEMRRLETLMRGDKPTFEMLLHFLEGVGIVDQRVHVILRGDDGVNPDLLLERPGG